MAKSRMLSACHCRTLRKPLLPPPLPMPPPPAPSSPLSRMSRARWTPGRTLSVSAPASCDRRGHGSGRTTGRGGDRGNKAAGSGTADGTAFGTVLGATLGGAPRSPRRRPRFRWCKWFRWRSPSPAATSPSLPPLSPSAAEGFSVSGDETGDATTISGGGDVAWHDGGNGCHSKGGPSVGVASASLPEKKGSVRRRRRVCRRPFRMVRRGLDCVVTQSASNAKK